MVFHFKPLAITISFVSLVLPPTLIAADNDWIKGITIDSRVEVEGNYWKDSINKTNGSHLALAKALLGVTGKVHEWSTVRLSFLHKEGETTSTGGDTILKVDETFITLGNLNAFPVYVKMGQVYLPFGRYETVLVSDPVTYNIANTLRNIGQLGFEIGGAYGSVYGYNGKTQQGSNNVIDHYGATLGFAKEGDNLSFDIGIDYLNDMGDVGDVTGPSHQLNSLTTWTNYKYVKGFAGHAQFKIGHITVNGEYLTALDQFALDQSGQPFLSFQGRGAEPKAWYAELGYTLKIGGRDTTFGIGYQATDEALAMDLPKKCYLVGLSMEVVDNTSLSLEYKRENNYSQQEGGTGGHLDTVTVQLAVDF